MGFSLDGCCDGKLSPIESYPASPASSSVTVPCDALAHSLCHVSGAYCSSHSFCEILSMPSNALVAGLHSSHAELSSAVGRNDVPSTSLSSGNFHSCKAPSLFYGSGQSESDSSTADTLIRPSEAWKDSFLRSYVCVLLPALRRIHNRGLSDDEKLSAIKLAANMSLALSAGGGKVWSQTLLQDVRSSASCFSLACTTVRGQGTLFKNVSAKSDSSRSSSSASLNVNGKGFGEDADACFLSPRSAPASCKVSRFSYSSVDSARGLLCSRMSTCFRGRMRRQRERRKQRRSTQRGRVSAYRRVLRSLKSPKKLKSKTHTISVKFNGRSRSSLHSISKEDIKGLESLIPGGRIMDVPLLLSETAHYILSLQMQVEDLSYSPAAIADPSMVGHYEG